MGETLEREDNRREFSGGEGMSEWKNTKLGEIISIKHGWAFKGEFLTDEGMGNPIVINIGNFKYNGGFRFNETKIKEYTGEFPPEYVLKAGDILLIMTCQTEGGEILGIPGVIPNDKKIYLHNQRLGKVIVKNHANTDQGFLYWYFLTTEFNQQLVGSASGTKIVHTAPSRIEACDISLPPLSEQKAIASILSSLDNKIDLLHRQNRTLEAISETLFHQWFVEEAQEDWEEVTISNFVELNRASADKNYPYQRIEYLDTGSLTEGKIESFQPLTLDEAPSRAKRLVQHNDVLISTVRPDQKHYGIIKNPIKSLVVSTGFCVITCTIIDPHFIYLLLTNDEMTNYLHTIAEGSTSTYPSLKPSDIGAISFRLPPDDKLKDFSVIARHSWEKIEKNYLQICTLKKLRNTLLPKLMSGEVQVKLSTEE
jgi:type I restriction enzyme, S subunit